MLYLLVGKGLYLLCVDTELLEDEVGNVTSLEEYSLEDVYRFDSLLTVLLRGVDGLLHHLLRLDCKLVECHIFVSFLLLLFFILILFTLTSNSHQAV